MNRLNWVQQNEDYNVKYHVIKWETSHFHEPFSNHMVGSGKLKNSGGVAVAAKEMQTEREGLGVGLADKSASGRLKFGLELEEAAARNVTGTETGRDEGHRSILGVMEKGIGTVEAVAQSIALAEVHAAENTITPVSDRGIKNESEEREQADRERTTTAQAGRGNIRNRLRESASRLLEAYRRYKEKAEKTLFRQMKQEKPVGKEERGTRAADRESVLAMQAENHYLLDSYDHTGNYSTLGKNKIV